MRRLIKQNYSHSLSKIISLSYFSNERIKYFAFLCHDRNNSTVHFCSQVDDSVGGEVKYRFHFVCEPRDANHSLRSRYTSKGVKVFDITHEKGTTTTQAAEVVDRIRIGLNKGDPKGLQSLNFAWGKDALGNLIRGEIIAPIAK